MAKTHVPEGRPPGIQKSDGAGDLSIGNICHVLQNERRRLTLDQLRNADEPVRTSDLAEAVAAIENDTTPEQLSHTERKRVYISLYQVHLPTLDDARIIAYDSDRGTIETLPLAHKLYDALDRLVDVTFPSVESGGDESEPEPLSNRQTAILLVATAGIVFGVLIGFGIANGVSGQIVWSILGPVAAASGRFS